MSRLQSLPTRADRRSRPARTELGPLAVGLVFLVVVAGGLPSEARADARDRSPATVTYDLLVERPLGLVELATGLAITPVAYPIAALASDGDVVVDECVRTPTRSTFTRALGRLDEDRRSGCSPVAFGIELAQLSVGAALQPLGWVFGGSPFARSESEDGIEV